MKNKENSHKSFLGDDNNLNSFVIELLTSAGIEVNREKPWDIHLNAFGVPDEAISKGNLGLGEAYMEGRWDAKELDSFFYKLLQAKAPDKIPYKNILPMMIKGKLINRQSIKRAWRVGQAHYDLGNDFYSDMLDSRMTYTCGYWKDANTLEDAQEAKLDLICRKLKLEPGMKVLDIGCGWGSFMGYAAEKYGVNCIGITISKEQANWAKNRYNHLPLQFKLQDYRETNEVFDRIVSIGMFEHVGHRNHREYMKVANRCLSDDGLFLLHTIGKNRRKSLPDPWIDKYIFPNGELPSIGQIGDAVDNLFVVEDLHNFGADYDKTLMAWYYNFEKHWHKHQGKLGEVFYRMWKYYLLSCAGAFRARDIQLWQWVLSKNGVQNGYDRLS